MADSKLFSNILGLGGNLLGGYLGQREINKGISAALGLSQPANINTPFASTAFNGGTLTNTLSPQAQGIFSGMLDASAANLASANIPAEAFASNFSEGLFKLVEGQEAEARARELDKLNAQGRFGTTGGTAQYGELLQGQALAGLTRALTSENLAFQRQSEMFNRAINLANTAGNLSQANLALSLQGRNNVGAQLAAQGGAAKGDFISSIFGSFGNAALEAAGIENPISGILSSIFGGGGGGAAPASTVLANPGLLGTLGIEASPGVLGGSFSGGAGAAAGIDAVTGKAAGDVAGGSGLFGSNIGLTSGGFGNLGALGLGTLGTIAGLGITKTILPGLFGRDRPPTAQVSHPQGLVGFGTNIHVNGGRTSEQPIGEFTVWKSEGQSAQEVAAVTAQNQYTQQALGKRISEIPASFWETPEGKVVRRNAITFSTQQLTGDTSRRILPLGSQGVAIMQQEAAQAAAAKRAREARREANQGNG